LGLALCWISHLEGGAVQAEKRDNENSRGWSAANKTQQAQWGKKFITREVGRQ